MFNELNKNMMTMIHQIENKETEIFLKKENSEGAKYI